MYKVAINITLSILVPLIALAGCVNNVSRINATPTFSCSISANGIFTEEYKALDVNSPVQIDIQLDISPYIDDFPPSANTKSLYTNKFPSTSKVIITPQGESSAEFSIVKVQTIFDSQRHAITIYTDSVATPQTIGGVLQSMPPIISFIDFSANSLNNDRLPIEAMRWNSFQSNGVALTSISDPEKYQSPLKIPRVPNGITINSCIENL